MDLSVVPFLQDNNANASSKSDRTDLNQDVFGAADDLFQTTKAPAPTAPTVVTYDPVAVVMNPKPTSKYVVKYKECMKNHAASIGGHANDGCGEFMPRSSDDSSLSCAACGCHRNFHRREGRKQLTPMPHHHHYDTTTTAPTHHHRHHQHVLTLYNASAGGSPRGGPPLLSPLPSPHPPPPPSHSHLPFLPASQRDEDVGEEDDEEDDDDNEDRRSETPERVMDVMINNINMGHSFAVVNSSSSGGGSNKNKRFRTKFTQEQKEKMLEFAERIGWRIQRHDDMALNQFCDEIGVKRNVLKVWMHNNKNAYRRREQAPPPPTQPPHAEATAPHPPPPPHLVGV